MKDFTASRDASTPDELWLLEHDPVFTQGQAGRAEHILDPGPIPVVQSDRGGQVTYHGPGQLIVYYLLDIGRLGWTPRQLVSFVEDSLVALLATFAVDAVADPDAPGVYVRGAKIASVGLRIKKGRSYHGTALNLTMDLSPFSRINPCGYEGMTMINLADLVEDRPVSVEGVSPEIVHILTNGLGYNRVEWTSKMWSAHDR
jgi:lipoyl(octanoyl) transferase